MKETGRKYTLIADHPLTTQGERCPACNARFKADDKIALIPVGPGPDPDNRRACREGRAYNAVAVPVHWACATGEEP